MPDAIAVHWEAAAPREPHSRCAGQVEEIRAYHLSHGYSDIAYSFIVCNHGQVFLGRGWDRQSAATCNGYWNSRAWSVCWMGGPGYSPSAAALGAIRGVILDAQNRGARTVIGHRDACATECPGQDLWEWVHAGFPGTSAPPTVQNPRRRAAMLTRDEGTGAIWLIGVGAARWILTMSEVNELKFVLQQDSIPNMNGILVCAWMQKFGAWNYELNAPIRTN